MSIEGEAVEAKVTVLEMRAGVCIYTTSKRFLFGYSHLHLGYLADALIQSDLQNVQSVHLSEEEETICCNDVH